MRKTGHSLVICIAIVLAGCVFMSNKKHDFNPVVPDEMDAQDATAEVSRVYKKQSPIPVMPDLYSYYNVTVELRQRLKIDTTSSRKQYLPAYDFPLFPNVGCRSSEVFDQRTPLSFYFVDTVYIKDPAIVVYKDVQYLMPFSYIANEPEKFPEKILKDSIVYLFEYFMAIPSKYFNSSKNDKREISKIPIDSIDDYMAFKNIRVGNLKIYFYDEPYNAVEYAKFKDYYVYRYRKNMAPSCFLVALINVDYYRFYEYKEKKKFFSPVNTYVKMAFPLYLDHFKHGVLFHDLDKRTYRFQYSDSIRSY